ncbi:MAG: 16S rRNA (uracil(1498)-N(3))-methyltransferase [Zoogloeaceae bacterium]|jgi:16S rRNA (uracil1498-N3)-methyltransferase|nr:16S rRNA (uracil(1498)-N(3))-methyltransferase [Zoogloeaceae bacterium]
MPTPRFFCPPDFFVSQSADCANLPPAVAHHAARVLRLAPGAALSLFDGAGGEYRAEILAVTRQSVSVRLGERQAVSRESPLTLTLAQTLQAADKMEFTLQKAVELGVTAIQPLAGRRSVLKLTGERQEKREARWQSILIAACEQCGRNHLPALFPVIALENWLAALPPAAGALRLMFAPEAEARFSELPVTAAQPLTLLIGAEGGFAPEETAAALAAGFLPVRLGARVLRTETAGLAALAAAQTLWGDFG